jgi:cytochrome b561
MPATGMPDNMRAACCNREVRMKILNTAARYGAVSQTLHWLTAAVVAILILTGMSGDFEPQDGGALYYWHTSLGLLVLLLVVARVLWRIVTPSPRPPVGQSRLAGRVAHGLHWLLYLLLVALPLSGGLAAAQEGGVVSFFSLVTLPTWAAASGGDFFEEMHEVLANVLLVVIALHALAALKHHYVDKDDVLRRMLP